MGRARLSKIYCSGFYRRMIFAVVVVRRNDHTRTVQTGHVATSSTKLSLAHSNTNPSPALNLSPGSVTHVDKPCSYLTRSKKFGGLNAVVELRRKIMHCFGGPELSFPFVTSSIIVPENNSNRWRETQHSTEYPPRTFNSLLIICRANIESNDDNYNYESSPCCPPSMLPPNRLKAYTPLNRHNASSIDLRE